MLIIGSFMHDIYVVRSELGTNFDMKSLGHAKNILGMDTVRNRADDFVIVLNQYVYV